MIMTTKFNENTNNVDIDDNQNQQQTEANRNTNVMLENDDDNNNNNSNNNNDDADEEEEAEENAFQGQLLHLSCIWNNPELLSDLLLGDEAKNIDSQDGKGRTALHEAVASNSLECARLLLMNGANPNIKQNVDIDSKLSSNKTALHLAVQRGNIDMVRLLLEFNVDIFLEDADGNTAMDLANNENQHEIYDLIKNAMIEYESNLYNSLAIAIHKGDTKSISKILNEFSTNGNNSSRRIQSIVNYVPNGSNTLLFKACQEGHIEIAKQLIQVGADGRQHPTTKYSPLYIASYHGRLQICQLLLEHFPELTSVYTVEHWLPIHAAVINNHIDIVQLLLSYPYPNRILKPFFIKPNHSDHKSDFSSNRSHSKSTKSLNQTIDEETIDCDNFQYVYLMPFDINAQDIAGQTILYLATLVGNQSLIDLLLNLRLKSISYDCSEASVQPPPQTSSSTTDSIDNDEDNYEDCISFSSSESSPDITVITAIDSKNISSQKLSSQNVEKTSTQTNNINNNNNNNSFRKLVDNLVSSNLKISDQKIYMINPIKIDIYCNHNMETALHCSVKKRHYQIASKLLENGADPNLPINGIISGNPSSIVTRVSHFNHNLFSPKLSLTESLKDLKNFNTTIIENSSENSNIKEKLETNETSYRSTALREAIRNRDKPMVDLLLRFGARDNLDGPSPRDDSEYECDINTMSALAIAFYNSDYHFVSKLLSLKAYSDSEFKVNKKSFDIQGSNCMNRVHMINNLTVSSMFPSNAVMIDWHSLRIDGLDESLHRNLMQWLIDAALVFNVKLKLNHNQDSGSWNTALAAITRIDLSENGLTSVPFNLFTDLPSLKILNLSKNKLQTLPELRICYKEKILDDDSLAMFRSSSSTGDSLPPTSQSPLTAKTPKTFLSMMRKSQSVTTSLSSAVNSNDQRKKYKSNKFNRNRSIDSEWNLPFLEELYLQDNQLECLPSSLFQQPELKILDLSNNKLRTLPPLFWFAPKLSELNLSYNLLCDLPSLNCLNQITLDSNSPTNTMAIGSMSKSVSTSSISSNLSINDLNKLDLESSNSSSRSSQLKKNLIPFELNILKPWSGSITILDDSFQEQFNNKTKDSIISNDDKHRSSRDSNNCNNFNIKNYSNCSLTQLNLSHNGFDRIPFFLSCLANRLTHLNISYNCLKTFFDPYYILGHYPLSLKHLDLSHNQITDWYMIDESDLENSEIILNDDDYYGDGKNILCFHSFSRPQKSPSALMTASVDKCCPYKQHTKLDNLKTLILSNNHLKNIIVTREELIEYIDMEFGSSTTSQSKAKEEQTRSAFNFFNLSSSFGSDNNNKANIKEHSTSGLINSSLLTGKLLFSTSNFGSQDDLHQHSNSMEDININYKVSKYSKLFFPNLSMLDLANNQIAIIPKTISYLHQLSVLNLSGNVELTTLPPEMGLLAKLWNLNTRGCVNIEEPLRSMINRKSYKTCDIISYLNSILENSKPYTRLKLMIVGYQSIGKTSLLEQLRHEGSVRRSRMPPDHWGKRMGNKSMNMKTPRGVTLSTVGVDLCEWTYERKPLKGSNNRDRSLSRSRIAKFQPVPNFMNQTNSIGPITFRTWDFGGQREYYATHQYFLSKRSIYLVVWRITDGEKGVLGLHSWLVNIQSRAPNSPVIIVGTHYDLVKEFYPPFYSNELQNMIRERYMSDAVDADKRGLPKVVASVEVSTKTRHNIRLLANLIYETAMEMRSTGGKDRLLEQKVPATYLALEEIITHLAMERKAEGLEPVLHAEQYRQEVTHLMRERYDITFRDYSELEQATRFLHENGVLLHYEDAHLKDLYFLDPQWLCDMLAHVVTIREINPFVKNGIMKTEHLLQLFKSTQNAPSNVQSYLLNLLNKFELAITWDNRTLLIPSLLPTEEQLKAGHVGWDIAIPLRSRLKLGRNHHQLGVSNQNNQKIKFEFKNQLLFEEFPSSKNSINSNNNNKQNVKKDIETPETEPTSSCIVTAIARYNQSIHRILVLSYVPCGFWSRLIARVLADETVIDIVRSFYCLPSSAHNDPVLIDFFNNIKTYWHCWQTGFGLRYLDTFLLRVKEFSTLINPSQLNFESKHNNNANFSSTWKNYSFPYDYNKIKFYLRQQRDSTTTTTTNIDDNNKSDDQQYWSPINISSQSTSIIEIYLPNQSLKIETSYQEDNNENDENDNVKKNNYILEPNMEMLTKLLVIIVEHIDTLLEDWYPSLGTRFIHTSDGKFLITRIVPCSLCMQDFVQKFVITNDDNVDGKKKSKRNSNDNNNRNVKEILSPDTTDVDSNLVDFYKLEVKKAQALEAIDCSYSSSSSCSSSCNNSRFFVSCSNEIGKPEMDNNNLVHSQYFRVNAFMVEECILSVYEDTKLECLHHGRIRMSRIAPDFVFRDLKNDYRIFSDQLKFGKLLGRGSFGFVFRAYYRPSNIMLKNVVSTTTTTTSMKKDNVSISNSKFYISSGKNENISNVTTKEYEVALKLLQPIKLELCSNVLKSDVEAYQAMKSKWERDPLQYSCKAYCTARTELNILLTLKHANIASIIGICPKPLALVLTLAPHGSLDVHIKAYRRSGARISSMILQKSFLQISKALEYLHQQHIIYRDLKSENVLVWSFPNPHTNHPQVSSSSWMKNLSTYSMDEVMLKLADYGISRSSLPTGTKGFGGTEGFMAPEIMLYNGEEEYTEKVDCFSFAMFMYELSTLRFPFEGHEFAIRENILDGIRPAISQKDLEYLPESFIDLMSRSWAHEPNERPTMSQIVSIISAPEFCSLRDVANLSENCALICAIGFQKTDINTLESGSKRFGLLLSKIGKQIDFLEVDNNKWNPVGHRMSCENLNKRTITSVCIVNKNQLWLGDSTACISVYSFSEFNQEDPFQLICLIQLEFENPASLTAIRSICWMENINLVTICSNNGDVWLLNFINFLSKLETITDLDVSLTSSLLGIKKMINNNSPTLCVANVSIPSPMKPIESGEYFDIWCGQTEGIITIFTLKSLNLEVVSQSTIDHYSDAHFNQFKVPIAERNDVFLLVGAQNQPLICSVLYSGYIIYQWHAKKRVIIHKLDCSKLAPCSESLMSISIEDHLKPQNCRISEVAIMEDNDEIYIGTNFGCIIIAELGSLKPITVFRPYQREVKFIITLETSCNQENLNEENINEQEQPDMDNQRQTSQEQNKNKDFSLSSSIKNMWPFNKSTNVPNANAINESKTRFAKIENNNKNNTGIARNSSINSSFINKKKNPKTIRPFVTIGRGYRNLLDRFTSNEPKKSLHQNHSGGGGGGGMNTGKGLIKMKDANKFHAIVWDSGFWNFS